MDAQPGPPHVSPALPSIEIAEACAWLIADPQMWINRRVETVEMLTHEETRRRVSVDFTLSEDRQAALTTDHGMVVPISLLTKEPRRNFDLRDETGRAIPVLGREHNGGLALSALTYAAAQAAPDGTSEREFASLTTLLRAVVFGNPLAAVDQLTALGEERAGLATAVRSDRRCRTLLASLWSNYVLFAVLPPGGPLRRILKYSYGEDFRFTRREGEQSVQPSARETILRPDRQRFVVELPGAWWAASFHAEIAIPEELRVERAALVDLAGEEPLSAVDEDVNRVSLYSSARLDPEQTVVAYVEVAPERTGRTLQAALTSATVAGLLWLGVASGLDAKNPGAAVSLLVAGAAAFSGLAASRGSHRLVREVFSAPRRWLPWASAAGLGASASLAMELPGTHPVWVWAVAGAVATGVAIRLGWSAVRAAT